MRPRISVALASIVAMSALGVAGTANAAGVRWYVATNGIDGTTCGKQASPCRTITQAIANASSGDTILVGPGDYGDIDGDGALISPGDETGYLTSGRDCLVEVNKPLTILSLYGASITRIDASSRNSSNTALESYAPVIITSPGVEFGRRSQGFSLIGARRSAGLITATAGDRVKIGGNIASGNGTGFQIGSTGPVVLVQLNLALSNETGFASAGRPVDFIRNAAQGNGVGFSAQGLTGKPAPRVQQNVSTGNIVGFQFQGPISLFDQNSAIGNLVTGVRLLQGSGTTGPTAVNVRNSNLYGNGTAVDRPKNCGISNESNTRIVADRIYWGAATGPGANPADVACNTGTSTTVTTPSAKSAVLVPDTAHFPF